MDQFPQKLWFRIMKDMKALGLGCGVRLWCCVVPLEFSVPSFHSPCTMPAPGSLCGTTAMFRMSFLRNQAIFVTLPFLPKPIKLLFFFAFWIQEFLEP